MIVFQIALMFLFQIQSIDIQATPDTLIIKNYLDSGDVYEYSDPDLAINWYLKAHKHIGSLAANPSRFQPEEKMNMVRLYALTNRYIGVVCRRVGRNREALDYNKVSLKYEKIIGNERGISMCLNNIGLIYCGFGDYEKALECYQASEKFNQSIKDSALISGTYTNIGQLHEAQEEFGKAFDYYKKSLVIKEAIGDIEGKSIALLNLGNVSYLMNNYPASEDYYTKALEIFKSFGDIQGVSMVYTNLSYIEEKRKNYEKALVYLADAMEIDQKLDDIPGIIITLSNTGNVLMKKGLYAEALEKFKKAEEMAKTENLTVHMQQITSQLSEVFKLMGNKDKALEYNELSNLYKDSLYSVEKSRRMAEMEVIHETEKKQLQIENLTIEQQISDLEIERQNQRMNHLMIIICLIVLALTGFIILLIRMHKINVARKKANFELSQRNDEVLQKNTEILAQRDEIDLQKDVLKRQKDEIEKLYSEVTDSILYAKRIQTAILPSKEMLNKAFAEHFVFYRPKDIVGGDFYYSQLIGDNVLIVVADCTGHGVPGGFMSMMGMAFLREIVNAQTISDPASILNGLRQKIIDSLQQTALVNAENTQSYADIKVKDGLDMGVVSLNRKTNKLVFSGANIPCIIVKKAESDHSPSDNSRFVELKGSRMPVSVYINMKGFDNAEIQVCEGDNIYLFTDGFTDQFGGENQKKFGRARFYNLLYQLSVQDVGTQKKDLEKEFIQWRSQSHQTDDITVIGVKV